MNLPRLWFMHGLQNITEYQGLHLIQQVWVLVNPNNYYSSWSTTKPAVLLHSPYPPNIAAETPPSTRTLPLSHIPLSTLFIFSQWVMVIYSQVSFSWAICGCLGGSGVTQSLRLASLVFCLAVIATNRSPLQWYASHALARRDYLVASLANIQLLQVTDGTGHKPSFWTVSSFHDAGVQQCNGACIILNRF